MKILKSKYPKLVDLMTKIYPDYKGRKFYLEITSEEFDTTSYWDEGSRTYFIFVKSNGETLHLPETHPFYQTTKENRIAKLSPGIACVKHAFFCGFDCGLTLMLHPSDVPQVIEQKF
jgi:hypothetical protein